MNKSIICALAVVAMVGCKKSNDINGLSGDGAVKFTAPSSITRTTSSGDVTTWESGDRVGISAAGLGFSHVEYKALSSENTTEFVAVDTDSQILASVNTNKPVLYSAYYPYSAYDKESDSYIVDIEDQTKISTMDLLYSQATIDYSTTPLTQGVTLNFSHMLSRLNLDVKVPYDMGELQYVIYNGNTKGVYKYDSDKGSLVYESGSNKYDVYMTLSNDVASAMIHSTSMSGEIFCFIVGGKSYYAQYPESNPFEAGKSYTHVVTIGEEGAYFVGKASINDWEIVEGEDGNIETDDVVYEWDGTIAEGFAGANGETIPFDQNSDIDTYYIQTPAQLAYFARQKCVQFTNKTVVLLNDIDLNDLPWNPIGVVSGGGNSGFTGTFEGNGHKITGLNVNMERNSASGLFGVTNNTTIIRNLSVEGNVTSVFREAGGIVSINSGLIENCSFSGSVTSTFKTNDWYQSRAGGIAGSNNGGTIRNCINRAAIKGYSQVGGITGLNYGYSPALISRCYNSGDVSALDGSDPKSDYFGGVVGCNTTPKTYNGEISIATIEYCHNDGEVNGYGANLGGIVGRNIETYAGGGNGYVYSCYNSALVKNISDDSATRCVIGVNTKKSTMTGNNGVGIYDCIYSYNSTGEDVVISSNENPIATENIGTFNSDGYFISASGTVTTLPIVNRLNIYNNAQVWIVDKSINNGFPIISGLDYTK